MRKSEYIIWKAETKKQIERENDYNMNIILNNGTGVIAVSIECLENILEMVKELDN